MTSTLGEIWRWWRWKRSVRHNGQTAPPRWWRSARQLRQTVWSKARIQITIFVSQTVSTWQSWRRSSSACVSWLYLGFVPLSFMGKLHKTLINFGVLIYSHELPNLRKNFLQLLNICKILYFLSSPPSWPLVNGRICFFHVQRSSQYKCATWTLMW